VRVEKGDIIIMGSDGLFDNLFDKDILSIVQSHVASRRGQLLSLEPQKISDELAERAKVVSRTKLDVESPFQEKAVNEGIYYQVSQNNLSYSCFLYLFIYRVERQMISVCWLLS
jgi:hypothetical protein